ncbi:MAG TPA: ATP phosphoribosyltransferase regulatory subunit [Clostridiaceae bacterium]|nr:ATP phosphoribosyltransferase regulatory subunit [Clostridiaceae bacterium]
MARWKIYTPEGVRDILFNECYRKKELESRIRELFRRCGYSEVESPTLEFFDVFHEENLTPQEIMFKTIDQQGRILVLRPDLTIPVARIAATKCRDAALPLKFFYIGNSYNFSESGGGRLKEFTQAGIEIMGVNTAQADAEVIAMAINAVKASGLEEFQIFVGQVDFFKGLMEDSGLSRDDMEMLKVLIESKDYVGIEELFKGYNIKKDLKELVLNYYNFSGTPDEEIVRFEKIAKNERSKNALMNLRKVLEILDDYNMKKYVSVDLGILQSMNYYTGIVFRGLTHGVGFPILSGGRYDNLVKSFGRNLPATGFALGINMVLTALERKSEAFVGQDDATLVSYGSHGRKIAFMICEELKKQGLTVEIDITGYLPDKLEEYAKKRGIAGIVYVWDEDNIELCDMTNGSRRKTSFGELLKK